MSEKIILGIDEVGRGPWAGPLVVGAVILGPAFSRLANQAETNQPVTDQSSTDQAKNNQPINTVESILTLWRQLTDSKKLTAKKREQLASLIKEFAAGYATGWVSAHELDQIGLSASLKLATRRAVKQLLKQNVPFSEIIIDGTVNFLQNTPLEARVTTLKKADSLIRDVSAASIIAKVERDRYMAEIAPYYPVYGFEKHVGYGTTLHRKALEKHGICPEHRQSFRPIREILAQKCQDTPLESRQSNDNFKPQSNTAIGQTAELTVASYLQRENHQIIAHNYKTKTAEIDLISLKNHQIFFTEVKYSQNPRPEASPLVRITPEKQHQMHYAAELFLHSRPNFAKFDPILAVAAVSGPEFTVSDWFTLS